MVHPSQKGGVRSRSLLHSRKTRKLRRPALKGYKAKLLSFLIEMSSDLDDTRKSPVEKLSAIRKVLKRLVETYDRATGKTASGELISQLDIVFAVLSEKLATQLRTAIGSMNSEEEDTFEAKVNEIIEDEMELESDGVEFIKGFCDFLEEFEEFAEDEDNSPPMQAEADALAAALVGTTYGELKSQFSALMAARGKTKRPTRRVTAAVTKKSAKVNRPDLNVNDLSSMFTSMKMK